MQAAGRRLDLVPWHWCAVSAVFRFKAWLRLAAESDAESNLAN